MAKKRTHHHEIVRRFATQIRDARLNRGLSQLELARIAKVSIAYVGKLERAEAAPGLDMVAKLASAVGMTVTELLGTEPAPANALGLARAQLKQRMLKLIEQDDVHILQAMAVISACVENASARSNT